MLIWALVRPARRVWIEALALAALLFAAVPFVNALTTPRNLFASFAAGDWLFAAFDAVMLLLAAGFGWAARKAARPRSVRAPRRAPQASDTVAAA